MTCSKAFGKTPINLNTRRIRPILSTFENYAFNKLKPERTVWRMTLLLGMYIRNLHKWDVLEVINIWKLLEAPSIWKKKSHLLGVINFNDFIFTLLDFSKDRQGYIVMSSQGKNSFISVDFKPKALPMHYLFQFNPRKATQIAMFLSM